MECPKLKSFFACALDPIIKTCIYELELFFNTSLTDCVPYNYTCMVGSYVKGVKLIIVACQALFFTIFLTIECNTLCTHYGTKFTLLSILQDSYSATNKIQYQLYFKRNNTMYSTYISLHYATIQCT